MNLESVDVINQPVDVVYNLVRDELDQLVPYLPNISKIEVESSEAAGDDLKKVNRWYAEVDAPGLIKKVIKPEMFSWIDRAHWNNDEKTVEYSLESTFGKDLFDARGKNYFKEVDGGTELRITCEVQIYADKVPGVPRLLAKKATPVIEGLLKKMLQPNLTALAEGLKGYYGEK